MLVKVSDRGRIRDEQIGQGIRWVIANKPNACAPIGGVPGAPTECAKDIQLIAITPDAHAIQARIDSVLFR